jgi:hypothetical protein
MLHKYAKFLPHLGELVGHQEIRATTCAISIAKAIQEAQGEGVHLDVCVEDA